jgi:hypothetical protein
MFGRLWCGGVGAVILEPNFITPWDETPLIGMNQKLGFVHFKIHPTEGWIREYVPVPTKEIIRVDEYQLIIHQSLVPEFKHWLKDNYELKLI